MPEADTYQFNGNQTLGYFSWTDLDTQRMLVAEPGGIYRMRACEPGLPVPPADGRWTGAQAPASPSSLPSTAPPKPSVTVPASTEGNEA